MKKLTEQLEQRVDVTGVEIWWVGEGLSKHYSGSIDHNHPRYIDLLNAFDDLNQHIERLDKAKGVMAEIIQAATKE